MLGTGANGGDARGVVGGWGFVVCFWFQGGIGSAGVLSFCGVICVYLHVMPFGLVALFQAFKGGFVGLASSCH